MSTAPRMPHNRAAAAASLLMQLWHMPADTCLVCGSVRRRSLEVGDLDIIAPHPAPGAADELFERMDKTILRQGTLFPNPSAFAQEISGLKPYFLEARLHVQLKGVVVGQETAPVEIPVQVCRYSPGNRGWLELMKTGPRDFNVWFLGRWKSYHRIELGGPADEAGGRALKDNHLLDAHGNIVPTRTEADCFTACGMQYIEPHFREAHAADMQRQRRIAGRETFR